MPPARNRQGKTFQTYLFMTPERLLNAETRQARHAVRERLEQKGVPVENWMRIRLMRA